MGTEGMKYSLVSREVIADCIETCGQRPVDGRRARHRRLRQEHAGRHDRAWRASTCRRSTSTAAPIKPGNWKGKDLTIVSAFEAVGEFTAGRHVRGGLRRHRAQRLPVVGLLRRHVHGQHDVVVVRGARHERCSAPRTMANPDDEKADSPRRVGARAGRGGQARPEAARHHHAQVDRERGRADHGDRRLDQRGAALPRDRARRRRRVDDRRLRARASQGAGALRPEAFGPVRRDGPAQGRRRSAGAEACCSTRACCTATA